MESNSDNKENQDENADQLQLFQKSNMIRNDISSDKPQK